MTRGESGRCRCTRKLVDAGKGTDVGQLFQYLICGESGRALCRIRRIKESGDGVEDVEGSGSDIAREPTTRLATFSAIKSYHGVAWGSCLECNLSFTFWPLSLGLPALPKSLAMERWGGKA